MKKIVVLGLLPPMLLLASCGSSSIPSASSTSSSANSSALKSWVTTNKLYLNQLGTDTGQIAKDIPSAAASGNYNSLITDCTNLEVDAQAAQLAPPIPNSSIQQHWALGLRLTVSAAKDCITGTETTSPALIERMSSEMSSANVQIGIVGKLIAAAG